MSKDYVIPVPGMVITKDVSFFPGVYNFFEKEGITIAANGITIDGGGAVFIGGKTKTKVLNDSCKDEFSYGYSKKGRNDSLGYNGIGIYSNGTCNVIVKNICIKNFEIGLKLDNCNRWSILNNDFSYNYHNPNHGWDEHDDLGGIVLYHTNSCKIENNRCNNVWNALTIRYGNENSVKNNDFSHTSNVGLRLWASCKNEFYNNNFSWGLRKEPNEVHARDSACVLIETGSNKNMFFKNDMRFGGDGLFIRSLNGWMSTGNYFEENDTSFANNNAIEAWDEGNTYVRNKASFSSYGFWLGNSDNTVLIENEVSYNGVNFKNAPENFGNAGISIVNGSGTNFKMIGNKIHDNNGPGVAIRNRVDYPSYNYVIEENEIFNNKTDSRGFEGHGIYFKYAKGISLIKNKIYDNDGEPLYFDEYVGDVRELKRIGSKKDIGIRAEVNSKTFITGKFYTFTAYVEDGLNLEFNWEFSDGEVYKNRVIKKSFKEPGFYRVCVRATDGENVNFDYMNIYVLAPGLELFEEKLSLWDLKADNKTRININREDYVMGRGALMLQSFSGRNITLKYGDNLNIDASDYTHFCFCIRYLNEIIDWYSSNKSPVIRFYNDRENYVEYTPRPKLFSDIAVKYNESKYKWAYVEIELEKDFNFLKKVVGRFDFRGLNFIEIYIDNNIDSHIVFMIDGMRFIKKSREGFINIADISNYLNDTDVMKKVKVSSKKRGCNIIAPLTPNIYFGDATKRWISSKKKGIEFYQIDLGVRREFNRIAVDFLESTWSASGEVLPEKLSIEYFDLGRWHSIEEGINIISSHNEIKFDAVFGSKVRLIMDGNKKPFSIYKIEINNTLNILKYDNIIKLESNKKDLIDIKGIGVKLNHDLNEKGTRLSNLIISIHEYEDDILNSKKLFQKEYDVEKIGFKNETIFDIGIEGLNIDKNYYVAMTQKILAKDLTNGQYYRWVGDGISQMDGSYGYINGTEIVSDRVGWGKNWMKIYTDKYILDMSYANDNLGNRFGLNGMERIYQKFTLKNPLMGILGCSISDMDGLEVSGEENISLTLKNSIIAKKLLLYFKKDLPEKAEVILGNRIFKGKMYASICEVDLDSTVKKLELSIEGKCILKGIDIL